MKRFLGVLIASMFLASAAFAADATKEEKKADSTTAEKSADEKAKTDGKAKTDSKAKTDGETKTDAQSQSGRQSQSRRQDEKRRDEGQQVDLLVRLVSIEQGGPPHLARFFSGRVARHSRRAGHTIKSPACLPIR